MAERRALRCEIARAAMIALLSWVMVVAGLPAQALAEMNEGLAEGVMAAVAYSADENANAHDGSTPAAEAERPQRGLQLEDADVGDDGAFSVAGAAEVQSSTDKPTRHDDNAAATTDALIPQANIEH